MQIESGTGDRSLARVDKEHNLHTRAIILSEFGHHSLDEESGYGVYMRHTFTAGAGNNEYLGHVINNGLDNIVIKQVTVATNAVSMKVEMFFDTVYTSGGELAIPLNLNRGSKKESSLVAYHENPTVIVMSTAAEKEFLDLRTGTGMPSFTYDFRDAFVLAPQTTFGFVGEASSAGEKVRLNVYYYELTEELDD